MVQETEEAVAALQVVSVVTLPPVGSMQTVETSSPIPSSPPLSPQIEEIETEEVVVEKDDSRPSSPKIVAFSQNQVFTASIEEHNSRDSFSPTRVTYTTTGDYKPAVAQFITASPRPMSPEEEEEEEEVAEEPQRLPSVLEAAMKAEPKVEVER